MYQSEPSKRLSYLRTHNDDERPAFKASVQLTQPQNRLMLCSQVEDRGIELSFNDGNEMKLRKLANAGATAMRRSTSAVHDSMRSSISSRESTMSWGLLAFKTISRARASKPQWAKHERRNPHRGRRCIPLWQPPLD